MKADPKKASAELSFAKFDWIDMILIFSGMFLVGLATYFIKIWFGWELNAEKVHLYEKLAYVVFGLVFLGPVLRRKYNFLISPPSSLQESQSPPKFRILSILGILMMVLALLALTFTYFVNVGSIHEIVESEGAWEGFSQLLFGIVCTFMVGAMLDKLATKL